MERLLFEQLAAWKNDPRRKPLILKGVRQVGKTWILQEFGRRYYAHTAYFNFDEHKEYGQLFTVNKDVHRILQELSLISGQVITEGDTLIIFDEIQDSPDVLNTLKYFCENAPTYHIACAGSLLGITLAKPSSFPVGKVNFMEIHPMSFSEFLMAEGGGHYKAYLDGICALAPIPLAIFDILREKLKMYLIIGGMPEAVKVWTESHDIGATERVLSDVTEAYQRDFAKHPTPNEFQKISMIWNSLPSQLARENKKFIYKVVKEGARAREYEDALQWLVNSNLVHKVYRISAPRLPLAAYDDVSAFKIYFADVGILRHQARLAPSIFAEGSRLFAEFKGALTENYILQALVNQFTGMPRYWSQTNPPYEVDFIIQRENDIIPVEVKADTNIKARGLQKFSEIFADDIKLRVRFSLENLRLDGTLLNIPLFMADQADRLIGMALSELKE